MPIVKFGYFILITSLCHFDRREKSYLFNLVNRKDFSRSPSPRKRGIEMTK